MFQRVFLTASLVILGVSSLAHAQGQVVLGAGQSTRVECTSSGGGGGATPQCIQQLTAWCNSNTSYNSSVCYQKASAYCPSTNFSDCVAQTTAWCNSNTSLNSTQCFDSALGSCRGNPHAITELMQHVQQGALLMDKGIDLQTLKIEKLDKKN